MIEHQAVDTAKTELSRFFQVASTFQKEDRGMAYMPCCFVDEVWHELLKDDAQYSEFTKDAVGSHVDHVASKGYGAIDWLPVYEAKYGTLNPIWFSDGTGAVDLKAYNVYAETGVWKASWDCGPGVHQKGEAKPNTAVVLTAAKS